MCQNSLRGYASYLYFIVNFKHKVADYVLHDQSRDCTLQHTQQIKPGLESTFVGLFDIFFFSFFPFIRWICIVDLLSMCIIMYDRNC